MTEWRKKIARSERMLSDLCCFANSLQFREYLEANGYDTSLMGIDDSESQIDTEFTEKPEKGDD